MHAMSLAISHTKATVERTFSNGIQLSLLMFSSIVFKEMVGCWLLRGALDFQPDMVFKNDIWLLIRLFLDSRKSSVCLKIPCLLHLLCPTWFFFSRDFILKQYSVCTKTIFVSKIKVCWNILSRFNSKDLEYSVKITLLEAIVYFPFHFPSFICSGRFLVSYKSIRTKFALQ